MKRTLNSARLLTTACLSLTSLLGGCGTTVGNGLSGEPLGVGFRSYSARTALRFPSSSASLAAGQLQAITICFKRIRFKAMPGDSGSHNVDLRIGEVTLAPEGTVLQNMSVPAGTYRRVEIDIQDKCASGKSVQLTTTNGTFSTTDAITLRFDGTTTITGEEQSLLLDIQAIVTALGNVAGDTEIRSAAEGADGSL